MFNLIYLIRIVERISSNSIEWFISQPCILAMLILCILLIATGIILTKYITSRDDSPYSHEIGRSIVVTSLEDTTGKDYFSNFSILALTALAIPLSNNIFGIVLYIAIIYILGVAYVKSNQIQINFLLTLMNYKTYRCKDKKTNEMYIIIVRFRRINENDEVRFQNMSKHILWFNK